MWWSALGMAQMYEPQPCEPEPELGTQLAAGVVGDLQKRGPDHRFVASTSQLSPSGQRPADPPRDVKMEDEGLLKAVDAWTCMYGAPALVDGDERTAWVEGVKGLGVGEAVVVPLPGAPDAPLEIRAGYGKSPELYLKNARPRRLEVLLIGPGWTTPAGSQHDLPVLGRHEVTLEDRDGWQPLPLPPWKPPEGYDPERPANWGLVPQVPAYLGMRVLEAVPGTSWEDTCISEVRVARGPG